MILTTMNTGHPNSEKKLAFQKRQNNVFVLFWFQFWLSSSKTCSFWEYTQYSHHYCCSTKDTKLASSILLKAWFMLITNSCVFMFADSINLLEGEQEQKQEIRVRFHFLHGVHWKKTSIGRNVRTPIHSRNASQVRQTLIIIQFSRAMM